MGMEISKTFPDGRGSINGQKCERQIVQKNFKMPSRKEKYIIGFLATCKYGCLFLQKLMFPSRLNKSSLMLWSFYWQTTIPKKTPEIFLEHDCIVRKKDNQAWAKLNCREW